MPGQLGAVLGWPGLAVIAGPAAKAFSEGVGKVGQGVEPRGGGDVAHAELGRDQQDAGMLQTAQRAELHDGAADVVAELAFQLAL